MSINLERLEQVAKPCSKEAIATARFRRENREWLKMSQEIALSLHYHLRTKEMSQKDLADKMGVSAAYVGKLLKGKENLTLETICKIQAALDENIINVARPYMTKQVLTYTTSIVVSEKDIIDSKKYYSKKEYKTFIESCDNNNAA